MPEDTAKKATLIGRIAARAETWLGLLLAALALFAAYRPWLFEKHPELCYSVNPVRTSLVKSGTSSFPHLRVTYYEFQPTNLTVASVAVWNRGPAEITSDRILTTNVYLRLPTNVVILDQSKLTEKGVGLVFTNFVTGLNKWEVGLSWKILQQDDGALIQIVYEGTPEAPITLEGGILGQRELTEIKSSVQSKWQSRVRVLTCFLIFVMGTVGTTVTLKKMPKSFWLWLIGLLFIAILAWALWRSISLTIPKTPFGF